MKIVIECNSLSLTDGYKLRDLTSGRIVSKGNTRFATMFSEDDLMQMLSERQYNQFENGAYQFEITAKQLSLFDFYYYRPSFSNDRLYTIKRANLF